MPRKSNAAALGIEAGMGTHYVTRELLAHHWCRRPREEYVQPHRPRCTRGGCVAREGIARQDCSPACKCAPVPDRPRCEAGAAGLCQALPAVTRMTSVMPMRSLKPCNIQRRSASRQRRTSSSTSRRCIECYPWLGNARPSSINSVAFSRSMASPCASASIGYAMHCRTSLRSAQMCCRHGWFASWTTSPRTSVALTNEWRP